MKVNIQNTVKNLGKDIKFLQPMYESITNSLEANATEIEIKLLTAKKLDDTVVISGFDIIDNGFGFKTANREAFLELWTDNKLSIGCKGSGRFTWLNVFENVNIYSEVVDEQVQVTIPFNMQFNDDDIAVNKTESIDRSFTKIEFRNVTDKFYNLSGKKNLDKRETASLIEIKNKIIDYLLIKFFLLKKRGYDFLITLRDSQSAVTITGKDIPDLNCVEFEITSPITHEKFKFQLYYNFSKDGKNSKKAHYCSNARSIKVMDDDSLGFSSGLPDNDSFIMLLCSDYFNGKDNDARNDFTDLSYKKHADLNTPLLFSDIKPELKRHMHKIILENYPMLAELNQIEEDKAIASAPFLTTFIRDDDDILKSKKSLLKKAANEFSATKARVQNRFEKLLNDKRISTHEFIMSVRDLSDVAAAELGEYIFYRDNIIKALSSALRDASKNEDFIHEIFMPRRTASTGEDSEKHMLSNLWLFDDKFMTYSYAASDNTVNQITEQIVSKRADFRRRNRPDLAVFFNRQSNSTDAIVVEFKGANAPADEKDKSLNELPNNIAIIKRNLPDTRTIWGYIVTTIDDNFDFTISNQSGYVPLFTSGDNLRAYYRYFEKQNAHIFIVDIATIISDAFARNKTFLDILKSASPSPKSNSE